MVDGHPEVAKLVAVARDVCQDAAALLRRRAAAGFGVRAKSAYEQVTDADVEAETAVRAGLCAAVPGSVVVGEELAGRPCNGVTWYVDPVDGTHNFLRGLPLACVSIGVAVGGRIVGGCVRDVFRDECFTGGEGVPFQVNDAPPPALPTGDGLPLVLTDLPLTGRPGQRQVAFFRDLVARADVRRLYTTALSLAWVAAGRVELACNLGIKPWDVAAGSALVQAAGGRYVPVGGADSVTASGFLASRPGLDTADALRQWTLTRLRAIKDSDS